jgi:hypothetical protein
MKLTYCSFVEEHTDLCTVCVIVGHFNTQLEAFAACQALGLFMGDGFLDGEFISWPVPIEEPLFENYTANTNRHILIEEARALFAAKPFREWEAEGPQS